MGNNNEQICTITAEHKHNIIADVKNIICSGMEQAYRAADKCAIMTYWYIGQRIVEEEQQGNKRAEYGTQLIKELAAALTAEFGNTYSERNLRHYRLFYQSFKDIEILNTSVQNLHWSHLRRISSVEDYDARMWYVNECSHEMWSYKTLDRNIATQYYERRLAVQRDSLSLPSPNIETEDPMEIIKSPVVAEFLGFQHGKLFDESELEKALIENLEQFMLEMGRGFAFVERQKHIYVGGDDYYIDLVFYNIKCHAYVLIDLKANKLTHRDIGQMDMYVRMFDDTVKGEGDNPTIGILLCSETNNEVARYSVLHDSDQLFATKYLTVMPTEEELRKEIERQKRFLLEQYKQ